jgi:hypothetical protein
MTLKPLVLTLMAAGALALAAAPSFARSGNAHAGGASASQISAQGAANTNGPNAADRDKGLDRAEDRKSTKGAANSNNPNAADRDKGLDRAEDRKSTKGLAHSKTQKHTSKHQAKKKDSTASQ